MSTRLIDDRLFTDESGSQLRGSRCDACGTTIFPANAGCPRCGAPAMRPTALPTRGRVWSHTVQRLRPKLPYRCDGEFQPYGVGYVNLGDVIVETRLESEVLGDLAIDQEVELCLVKAFTDDDGSAVLIHAFRPVADPVTDPKAEKE